MIRIRLLLTSLFGCRKSKLDEIIGMQVVGLPKAWVCSTRAIEQIHYCSRYFFRQVGIQD